MSRYNATLYFRSKQSAMEAGYRDAVKTDEDDFPYMAVVTFFADQYDIEEDDDLFEVAV
jgi:hypothetical protein